MMMAKQVFLLVLLLFIGNAFAQVSGCTDPLSANYNPAATINDGSCTYAAASVAASSTINLPAQVVETSGLITWNGNLFTHNDNTNTTLYGLNPDTGAVQQTLALTGVTNQDWEEIAQDDDYIYIGDFGNNSSGNRTNLKIIKVEKASLLTGTPVTTTINFSYSNQTNFTATGGNNTNFDCEAFVVSNDSIYLFTKQWVAKQTSVYALPKTSGTHIATLQATYNVNGLITGATYMEDKKLVVLCGYSSSLQPFLYLLYDFSGHNFFSGNKRKVTVPLSFHQVEGITTTNGFDYYATNEYLSQYYITVPQKLHHFDMRPFLESYIPEACGTITTWNGSSWTNGAPSSYGYAAIIEGDYNSGTHGSITACSLDVNSGTVTVSSETNFIIKGTVKVANGAALTIENNASLIQEDDVVNSGTMTVKKNSSALYHLDYTLWSSPVNGSQTLKEFSPGTLDHRFYVYNTTEDTYDNYQSQSGQFGGNPNEVTFTTAKGYLIRLPHGLPANSTHVFEGAFTGTLNNGALNIALGTGGSRYNAVGNPYPSPINIYDFIDANAANLETGTLYFWRKTNNPNANSYAAINKLAYIANSAAGGNTGGTAFTGSPSQWLINSGQGFYVQASAAAQQLQFTNSMRRAANNNQFFRTNNSSDTEDNVSRIWLNLENESAAFSQAAIGYTANATTGLDFGFDGLLLSDDEIAIYSLANNTKLSIQARPQFTEEDVVQLGYNIVTAGSYSIRLDRADGIFAEGQAIYINDKLLNTIHNLNEGAYNFTADAGTISNRFEIVYTGTALNIDLPHAESMVIYKQNKVVNVKKDGTAIHDITVFDLSGRKVYTKNGIDAPEAALNGLAETGQVLLVQVTTADNKVVTKKIIN